MAVLDPRASQGVAAAAALIVTVLSWQHGYQAAYRAVTADRTQIASLTERLGEMEALVQAGGGDALWRSRQEQRLAALDARFPSDEQLPALLNALVDAVKTAGAKLLNTEQGTPEPVLESGQPVLVGGLPCYQLPVTVSAEGRFGDVVRVVEQVTGDAFPSAATLEAVDLRLKDPVNATLDINLTFHVVVVGHASAS
jgi:hypothetical protein